jgi:hypothetical protein
MARPIPSVLAVAEHTGWAHIVCVSARDRRPFVVSRRRVALIDDGLPTQPYEHDTRALAADEADALVATVRKSAERSAAIALRRIVDEVGNQHPVAALTIRTPPFEQLPASVAEVHASYQLMCAADGLLFNLAIRKAARRLELEVHLHRRGGEIASAAAALKVSPEAIEAFVTGSGRPAGPPWSAEHRLGYAAAIAALATRVRGITIR